MFKKIAELIKVKTIVTIIVLAVWAHLAVTGAITADAVNNVSLRADSDKEKSVLTSSFPRILHKNLR